MTLDASYLTPFENSVTNVLATMLQAEVTPGAPTDKPTPGQGADVTGIIGMSGEMVGSVAVRFPRESAVRLVTLFSGMEIEYGSPDFTDAIGELVNMICGGAKASFPVEGVSISCPSVVMGSDHLVASRSDAPSTLLPFETDCGPFSLEISLRGAPAATA